MDEDIKKGLKKIARNAEERVAGTLLRWKFKKEGKKVPDDRDIEALSRDISDRANLILSKTGKTIWSEMKSLMNDARKKEDNLD